MSAGGVIFSYGMERFVSETLSSGFTQQLFCTMVFGEDRLSVVNLSFHSLGEGCRLDPVFQTQQVCFFKSVHLSFPEDGLVLRTRDPWAFLSIRVSLGEWTSHLSIRWAHRMLLSQGETMASNCFSYLGNQWTKADQKLIYCGHCAGAQPYMSL